MGNKSSTNVPTYPQHDDPAYRKCQELKMERWIQMHYQIKEREEAKAIAHDRELFYWLSGFYITSLFGCTSFYQRTRRPVTLLPIVPLSFVMGYYADLAYGSKIHRIKDWTVTKIVTKLGLLGPLLGVPPSKVNFFFKKLALRKFLITAEANMIMEHEPELLHWPGGLPTVATIDEARMEAEMEKKMHPHHS